MTKNEVPELSQETTLESFDVQVRRPLQSVLSTAAIFATLLAITSWNLGTPSLWADEIATISASNRPIDNLLNLLGNIDGVHGTYYLLIHYWGAVFGFSPLSIRFPSAIAACLAVILTWKLANRLFGSRVGWIALAISAVMPRTIWAATEGRSYAITELVAVGIFAVFISAIELENRHSKWAWFAFTMLATLGNYLFIYLVLLQIALGLWLWVTRSGKKNLIRWFTSFAISASVSGFIFWRAYNQQHQVHWLPPISDKTLSEVLVGQFFWMTPAFACLTLGIVMVYLLGGKREATSLHVLPEAQLQRLLVFAIAFPTLALIAYSVVRNPIYDSRYLAFATPFAAILIAAAVSELFTVPVAAGIVAALALVSTVSFLNFRAPDAKLTDWAAVAQTVKNISRPGDGILYGDFADQTPTVSRLHIGYPSAFEKVTDISLAKTASKTYRLFDTRLPLMKTSGQWSKFNRLIFISDGTHAAADAQVLEELSHQGYVATKTIQLEPEALQMFEKQH